MKDRLHFYSFIISLFLIINLSLHSEQVGPYLGTIKSTEAYILYSADKTEKELTISLTDTKLSFTQKALKENDYVVKFHIKDLKPGQKYHYTIRDKKSRKILIKGDDYSFTTLPKTRRGKFKVAFVACVNSKTVPVWEAIQKENIDALCLAGDTPYIDSTDMKVIRDKHRKFLQTPALAKIGQNTSTLGNWDDHDFGVNNGNGVNFKDHKAKTRQAFVEYRAHDQYGDGKGGGIYHKTDHGPIEIFHLDPRWYSQTAPSPVDPSQVTCFGKEQWQWLLKSLKESKAPFKVLSMGAIWQDKRNWETDDMFTYWYERDALLNFIKEERIPGVILHGGDIHVSRYLKHPMRLGYDLHDFIMSPGHTHIIRSLDVYHPSYEWSLVDGQQYLTIAVDTTKKIPTLTAQYRQGNGKLVHEVKISYDQLSPSKAKGLAKDLRAYWNFDGHFKNSSVLGSRLNASAPNESTFTDSGIKGKALNLDKSKEQYLNIPRSFLDDNSAQHSVSLWFKASTLPKHKSNERNFLFESTAEGKASDKTAYHLSLGLRSTQDSDKVNLQLYTEIIKAATAPQKAPTDFIQGPFNLNIERSKLLKKWNHLVLQFNSKTLDLYLNGQLIQSNKLSSQGPAAEFGGLIIGGHRNGTGRNFDGMIDEVAIWQRLLNESEISELYQNKTVLKN